MVGLAVLSLLAGAAEEQPLVCLVDDAQWLDRASVQALTFVARRLLAEPVGLVFAVREPSGDESLADLPSSTVDGLGEDDARALLAAAIPGPFDEQVRNRIIGESRGNPLALLELHRGMTAVDLASRVAAPDSPSVARRIEDSFQRRLEGSRRIRDGCCCSRRPSRSATRPSSGGPSTSWAWSPTPSPRPPTPT